MQASVFLALLETEFDVSEALLAPHNTVAMIKIKY